MKYSIGDKVIPLPKPEDWNSGPGWVDEMDLLADKVGVVKSITYPWYDVLFDNKEIWTYKEAWLKGQDQ